MICLQEGRVRAEPRAGQGELGRAGLGLPSVCRIRPGAQTRLGQDPALLVLRGSRAAPAASSPSADVPKQDALHPKAPSTRALSLAASCSFPPFLPSLWRGGFGVWSRGSPPENGGRPRAACSVTHLLSMHQGSWGDRGDRGDAQHVPGTQLVVVGPRGFGWIQNFSFSLLERA